MQERMMEMEEEEIKEYDYFLKINGCHIIFKIVPQTNHCAREHSIEGRPKRRKREQQKELVQKQSNIFVWLVFYQANKQPQEGIAVP